MTEKKQRVTPVYFVLGPSYHGAGALSWRLNHHGAILSLGTANPDKHGVLCSCGENTQECPYWAQVRDGIYDLTGDVTPFKGLLPDGPFVTHNLKINRILNTIISIAANEISQNSWKLAYEAAQRYYMIYDRYLALARDLAPHRIYVDAERSNMKFMIMASMGFPVRGAIHMIRDPRAYAAAWKRYYPESTVERSTLEWVAAHSRIKRLASIYTKTRFLRVKYEDLADMQTETLTKILNFMKVKGEWPEGLTISEAKNHLIGLGPQDREIKLNSGTSGGDYGLTPDENRRVIKVAGSLFSEFGYKA